MTVPTRDDDPTDVPGARPSDDAPESRSGRARTLLVAGTASHVGKSTVAAGLCRHLADAGVDVAPFKGQNMSNNARAVPRPAAVRTPGVPADRDRDLDRGPDGEPDRIGARARPRDPAFGEVGVSQYVQARAARVRPTTDHNPVLLKPRGDGESQVVIDGVAVAHEPAGAYYEDHWGRAREAAVAAHARLAAAHDVVIAEGAGSIAEINLHDRDLANVETARAADAAILLVADIERGGVFASLVGTLELLPDDLRDRVVGAAITKFRGDRSLLAPGLDAFEARTGVPVVGVLPYDDPGLPEEDSLALPAVDGGRGAGAGPEGEAPNAGGGRVDGYVDSGDAVRGADDGVADDRSVTVGAVRLPRLSNATDLEPLAAIPGVRVAYRPPDAPLRGLDAVILPGTKNAVDDLLACRTAGLGDRLAGFDGPVVGLCGGYQLLGERLTGAAIEGTGPDAPDVVPGLGLLPVTTRFEPDKRVAAVEWCLRWPFGRDGTSGSGAAATLSAGDGTPVTGYEIHAGRTRPVDGDSSLLTPFAPGPDEPGDVALGAAVRRSIDRPGGGGGSGVGVDQGSRRDGTGASWVLGTYLHGLFENVAVREAFVDAVYGHAGRQRPSRPSDGDLAAGEGDGDPTPSGSAVANADATDPYDRATRLVREHVDLAALGFPS